MLEQDPSRTEKISSQFDGDSIPLRQYPARDYPVPRQDNTAIAMTPRSYTSTRLQLSETSLQDLTRLNNRVERHRRPQTKTQHPPEYCGNIIKQLDNVQTLRHNYI